MKEHSEAVARVRAGDVRDLAVFPGDDAPVPPAHHDEATGPAVQLHPLEQVREADGRKLSLEGSDHAPIVEPTRYRVGLGRCATIEG
jgi:hypothetical protein